MQQDLDYTYVILVALSVVVAAVGLVNNNVAVIIGAMVIAPLLTPNVALSLSTTLSNPLLAKQALITLGVGITVALGLSFLFGMFLDVDPTISEIALRTNVNLGDVVIGLVAGAAAALFFSMGIGTSLVGVTVAAAILPLLVVTGLLMGTGEISLASRSLLLLTTNLIGINLAGTLVFMVLGVWPNSWWEGVKAKRKAVNVVVIWTLLLLALILILMVSEGAW